MTTMSMTTMTTMTTMRTMTATMTTMRKKPMTTAMTTMTWMMEQWNDEECNEDNGDDDDDDRFHSGLLFLDRLLHPVGLDPKDSFPAAMCSLPVEMTTLSSAMSVLSPFGKMAERPAFPPVVECPR